MYHTIFFHLVSNRYIKFIYRSQVLPQAISNSFWLCISTRPIVADVIFTVFRGRRIYFQAWHQAEVWTDMKLVRGLYYYSSDSHRIRSYELKRKRKPTARSKLISKTFSHGKCVLLNCFDAVTYIIMLPYKYRKWWCYWTWDHSAEVKHLGIYKSCPFASLIKHCAVKTFQGVNV
jgi:hypothetical protein